MESDNVNRSSTQINALSVGGTDFVAQHMSTESLLRSPDG